MRRSTPSFRSSGLGSSGWRASDEFHLYNGFYAM
jgi:hypothetical protein